MCLTQNPDAIPAEPFLKYPKVSIPLIVSSIHHIKLQKLFSLRIILKVPE